MTVHVCLYVLGECKNTFFIFNKNEYRNTFKDPKQTLNRNKIGEK